MSTVVAARRDPELPARPYPPAPFDPPNPVYEAVEAVLELASAPRLQGIVQPGHEVLIKPNFVTDRNFHERLHDRRLLASSTHAAVIRPLIDFALERGAARVTVADTPVEGCDLEPVTRDLGFKAMLEELERRGRPVRFLDLRPFRVVPRLPLDDRHLLGRSWNFGMLQRKTLPGDPEGYRAVDLGPLSAFAEVQERTERLRFHRANPRTPIPHHSGGHHEYGLPQSVLDSDVIIHVPKLKTHKKSGVTLSLKSAIGLCGYKYWLPHYTAGVPPVGDERSSEPTLAERLSERLSRLPIGGGHSLVLRAPRLGTRAPFTEGSWEGNDTIWRTTLDLARILLYADRAGVVRDVPVRACFALVDGLVAGQGDGPFGVEPLDAGLLLAGSDLALVDAVAAGAMGFDWRRIRTIAEAIDRRLLPSTSWALLDERWEGPPPEQPFTPPSTWPSLGDAAPRPAQRTA